MQIGIKKVGERDGKERFVLFDQKSGDQIVKKDNSEPTLRKWLAERGFEGALVDKCFELARKEYSQPAAAATPAPSVPEDSDEMDLDFFLAELEEEDG